MLAYCAPIGPQHLFTWRLVVADSEVRRYITTDVGKTLTRAVLSVAANVSSALPDDLGKVTPVLEVAHIWLSLAVKAVVPADLSVVEQVGNDGSDIVTRHTGSNVLAIATTHRITGSCQLVLWHKPNDCDLHVVSIDAA